VILLRKAQVRIVLKVSNLRFDYRELTLELADLPALARRRQLLFLVFHDASRMHSGAIALS